MKITSRMVARISSVGVVLACGVLASASTATSAQSAGSLIVPVDRQDYVTAFTTTNPQDGSTIDPYDADPSSIHVAITSGSEFARSFVHLALDYVPPGSVATDATVTMHLPAQSDASNTGVYPIYNVNTSAAIIQACALVTELPAKFDYSKPPAYDCQHGSTVGTHSADGLTWTFHLKNLVAYWNLHGNTGAALVPVGSGDPSQTWQVAFYKSRSSAMVAYRLTTPTPTPPTTPTVAGSHSTGGGYPSTAVTGPAPTGSESGTGPVTSNSGGVPTYPSIVAPAQGNASVPAVSQPATGTTSTIAPRPASGGVRTWPWVLLGCFAIAAGALGWTHRAGLMAGLPRMTTLWRTHPRAYSVATVAVVWGLIFSAYSISTQPTTSPANANAQAATATNTTPTPGSTTATPGASNQSPGASSTVAHTGSGVGTSVTGAGTATGAANDQSVQAAKTEFNGPGTYRTINGVQVFFPANGGPPVAQLYSGADDVVGINANQIELCAHAALTYGSAFNISASDLNVYWSWLNDHGGIFGRKVHGDYENDNYDPGTAVQAAQKCKDLNSFLLIGGIGFDQIPAVRQWAEQNHELYFHHIATIEGSAGLRYSFSPLPTVEQMGTLFGQLAVQKYKGQKIGVLYRDSSNWTPGSDAFTKVVKAAGMQVVSYGVTINQGNYTQELTQLNTAGVKVVFAWENALATVEMIKQAQGQDYHPSWLVFPFNIETQSLGSSSLDQPIMGVAAWEAYDPNYYGGLFNSYAADIHEFEAEYKQYDSGANLGGDGGDLLFLNWEADRQMADLLRQCGQGCTRNKMAGILLAGYHRAVSPTCDVNFGATSDHHHGGSLVSVLQVQKDPNGRANFVPLQRCVSSIGG